MHDDSHSSLIPGYKQVEKFGADEEYEDEEVSYVTLDLGSVEPTLLPSSSTYRLIGLDTPTPFLQLSGTIFKGSHDSLLGTEILLAEETDAHDRNKKPIAPFSTTEQRIRFKEVTLKPKVASHPQESEGKEKVGVEQKVAKAQGADRMTGKVAASSSALPTEVGTTKAKKKGKGRKRAVQPDGDVEMETVQPEGTPEDDNDNGGTSRNAAFAMDISSG